MEDIIFRFFELVETLESDDSLTILKWETFRGASEADFDNCEKVAQIKIGNDVREFFRTTNGMQLFWIKNQDLGSMDRFEWTQGCLPPDFGEEDIGCINIWPINQIFEKDWSETIYFEQDRNRSTNFNSQVYNTFDFKRRFFPMDLYSKYDCFGFFALENEDLEKILLAEDYYLDFKSSIPTDFRSYLEFLLASKASISSRKYFSGDKPFSNNLKVGDIDFWTKELSKFNAAL